jgi:hypothetical protein
MPIYPLQSVFYPQNRPCTPKIVGTFYMQGYKVKEKTAIVPHCTPSFKTQWVPCGSWIYKYRYLCNQCLSPQVVSLNTTHGEVYSIQHHVIHFISDLQQVFPRYSGFLYQWNWLPWYNWNFVESDVITLNTITLTVQIIYKYTCII